MFFRRYPAHSRSPRDLERLSAALGMTVDQFGREMGRHRSRRTARQSRGLQPARLSSLPGRRRWIESGRQPERRPLPYRRGVAPTILSREWQRYGRPQHALDVERRAAGITGWVRWQLMRVRNFLGRIRDHFRWRRSSSRGGDQLLTVLVLATTIGLGLEVVDARRASIVDTPPGDIDLVHVNDALEMRIDDLAYAIAIAEGYFSEGIHDGATLPALLNNPGSLKKPALDASDLPTWKDTGLIWFPTAEKGWAALRQQIRLMLTGTSAIYAQSDSLMSVGDKYADGDVNWGVNVATTLGVPAERTLAELVPRD